MAPEAGRDGRGLATGALGIGACRLRHRAARRVTRRPISLILDTSAIVAFTNESIDVGETIAEARDNGALIGLPVVCLVKSGRAVRDHDRLHYLVSDPATR